MSEQRLIVTDQSCFALLNPSAPFLDRILIKAIAPGVGRAGGRATFSRYVLVISMWSSGTPRHITAASNWPPTDVRLIAKLNGSMSVVVGVRCPDVDLQLPVGSVCVSGSSAAVTVKSPFEQRISADEPSQVLRGSNGGGKK